MKTLLKSLAIVFLFSTSVMAKEKKHPRPKSGMQDEVTMNPLADKTGVLLQIRKAELGYTIVTVLNGDRDEVYTEKLPNELFIKRKYLLTDDGKYFFVIEADKQKVEKEVTIGSASTQTVSVQN